MKTISNIIQCVVFVIGILLLILPFIHRRYNDDDDRDPRN
jgi:hypothetical protein